ncbi:glutamine synthetase [Xylaria arbuscula]|nr:glutamine synthetase [Xylaria arbuscula]
MDNYRLCEFLAANKDVEYLRILLVDFSGVRVAHYVPVPRCPQFAYGDDNLDIPETNMCKSLRTCGFQPKHATVMACVGDDAHAYRPCSKCPRTLMIDAVEELEVACGTILLLGFDIEVVLLDQDDVVVGPEDGLYVSMSMAHYQTLDLVEEIKHALEIADINIHHFQMKGNNKYEFALAPEPALKAVDSLILAQEIIRTISARFGIKATMTPKPAPLAMDHRGHTMRSVTHNGLHLRILLDHPRSLPKEDFILAGLLSHMPSLCAFGMASYDSYWGPTSQMARDVDDFGTILSYLPVRKSRNGYYELRIMDSTANPYLFVSAVLHAALDGFENFKDLHWSSSQSTISELDNDAKRHRWMTDHMPASLEKALEHLKRDKTLEDRLGRSLVQIYIHLKEQEVQVFERYDDEERRLKFLEYF